MTKDTGRPDASGVADPSPLAAPRPGAHSAPAAPRTLSLLAVRPLTLNTRASEGVPPPTAARSDGPPVVTARWPGTPAAPQRDPAPPAGAPARPTPGPSAVTPAIPPLQRGSTTHPTTGPEGPGVQRPGASDSVQRVPVVRPAPPQPMAHGPVAQRAAAFPGIPSTAPAPAPAPAPMDAAAVPVVRLRPRAEPRTEPRTESRAVGAPGPGPVPGGGSSRTAPPVQRDITGTTDAAVPAGVPAKAVPARGRSRSASAPPAPAKGGTAQHGETPQDPGLDLDDLARRLLDPVSRLLRTELRRGRERMGRPYDGRR
ncbi:hypothetical protein [Streptomyces sp. NPDC048636]|uniref:hypothetical protein n=1 Tax=Streptomyces sp. NPDC048636 TaxID=3155762 RepID=UPI00343419C7